MIDVKVKLGGFLAKPVAEQARAIREALEEGLREVAEQLRDAVKALIPDGREIEINVGSLTKTLDTTEYRDGLRVEQDGLVARVTIDPRHALLARMLERGSAAAKLPPLQHWRPARQRMLAERQDMTRQLAQRVVEAMTK